MTQLDGPRDAPEDRARRGGFSLREYDARVWDMAKHLLHPALLYVAAVVVGATRLTSHPSFSEPGAGALREAALFAAGFLGSWAVFYSTMLRTSGIRSLASTALFAGAVAADVVLFVGLPPPARMTAGQALLGALLLVGPGPVGWALTLVRWRRARRAHAHLLEVEARA